MAVIGIDLGTTTSLCACYRNGYVELIPNSLGSYFTPSVVHVNKQHEIFVGESAKQALISDPTNTVRSFKKDMGTDKVYRLNGQKLTPVDCSSFIVRSLVDDAKKYLNEEIDEVIISVPAYFHDKQRLDTKKAAQLANVKVERLINEPSAAALASYFDTSKEQLYCVFDFGGGTLDISIVDCFENVVEILSVAGDNHLGGDNFHDIMVNSFIYEHQLHINDKQRAILYKEAEKCKRNLSVQSQATMSLNFNNKLYESHYTRERLLKESGTILTRIKEVLTQCLRANSMNANQIDEVILAGGSSKMPIIQDFIRYLFHKDPILFDDCDQLIAKGLGYVCGVKQRKEEIKDYVLSDICPFSLGIGVLNETDLKNEYFSPIIHRNTILPCSRVKRFYSSHDYQEKLDITCYQGENVYAKNNLQLAKIEVEIPKNLRGEECADVRFTYDINGILEVDIMVCSTKQTYHKVVSQTMNEEEINQQLKHLSSLKVHPKDDEKNIVLLKQLNACYEQAAPFDRENILNAIKHFEYILNLQDSKIIQKTRKEMIVFIQNQPFYDPFADSWFDEEENEEESEHQWIS